MQGRKGKHVKAFDSKTKLNSFEAVNLYRRIILKWIYRKIMGRCRIDLPGLGQRPVRVVIKAVMESRIL